MTDSAQIIAFERSLRAAGGQSPDASASGMEQPPDASGSGMELAAKVRPSQEVGTCLEEAGPPLASPGASEGEVVIDVDLYAESLEKLEGVLQEPQHDPELSTEQGLDSHLHMACTASGLSASTVLQELQHDPELSIEQGLDSHLHIAYTASGLSASTVRGIDSGFRKASTLSQSSSEEPSLSQTASAVGVQRTMSLDLQGDCALRGIRANHVLRFPGRIWRSSDSKDGAWRLSKEVECIQWFLSHSWQASARAKYCAVCLHFRWKQSLATGMLTSLASVLLFPRQLAPQVQVYTFVALASGLCALLAALAFWPVRDNVFLDKACIDQVQSHHKRDGIMSLGYFLRRSTNVLVLWDESFFTRLWCVFEYAASLKLSEARVRTRATAAGGLGGAARPGGPNIVVQPLAHIVMMMTVMLGNTLAVALSRATGLITGDVEATSSVSLKAALVGAAISILCIVLVSFASDTYVIEYVQATKNLFLQLKNFKTQTAQCSCCTLGHTDPVTLEHIPCDRTLIEATVTQWFGTTRTFDRYVQKTLQEHVSMQVFLPYRYVVFSSTPFLIDGIAGLVWYLKAQQLLDGLAYGAQKLWVVTVIMPLVWFAGLAMFQRFPRSRRLTRALIVGAACTPHIVVGRLAMGIFQAWAYLGLVPLFGGITFACYRR